MLPADNVRDWKRVLVGDICIVRLNGLLAKVDTLKEFGGVVGIFFYFNFAPVPLRFFFSFRLNKNNPRDFITDQYLDKFWRLWYKIYHHNPLGKYFNIELKRLVA